MHDKYAYERLEMALHVRSNEARMVAMEARLREIETGFIQRLDAMAARIEALAGETESDRRTAFDDLARSVIDLGERIRRISKD